MADDQPAAYCTLKPAPGTYLTAALLGSPCDDCGHVLALHVGTDHCPVCELVDLNAKARSASPSGMSLADRAYAAVVKRIEDDRRRSTYTPLGNG